MIDVARIGQGFMDWAYSNAWGQAATQQGWKAIMASHGKGRPQVWSQPVAQ